MQVAPTSLLMSCAARAKGETLRRTLTQQQRPTLEGIAIRFANAPFVVHGKNAQTGNPLVVPIVRDERNVEADRACRSPGIRPFNGPANAEPHSANGAAHFGHLSRICDMAELVHEA